MLITNPRIFSRFSKSGRWCLLYLLALTLITGFVMTLNPYLFMTDDAYFYLKVAQNLSEGKGSSFSGLAPTNGYHPLWQWTLALVYRIFHPGIINGLILSRLFTQLCMFGTLLFFWFFSKKVAGASWSLMSVALLSFLATRGVVCTEFWLYGLTLTGLLNLGLRWSPSAQTPSMIQYLTMGLVQSLVILSRLDSVLVLFCWSLTYAWLTYRQSGWKRTLKYLLFSGMILLPVLAAYAGYTLKTFGHIGTISAMIKTSTRNSISPWTTLRLMDLYLPGGCCALIYLIWFILKGRKADPVDQIPEALGFTAAIALSTLLHGLIVLFFTNIESIPIWYWMTSFLMLALVAGLFGQRILNPRLIRSFHPKWGERIPRLIVGITALWQVVYLIYALSFNLQGWHRELADHYRNEIPSDAIIFQVDGTGRASYLSGRTIINGDGLMNNMEYQEALRDHRLLEYLDKYRVTHLIQNRAENISDDLAAGHYQSVTLMIPGYIFHRETPLTLYSRWEVARWSVKVPNRFMPFGGYRTDTFVVWRLPEDRSEWMDMKDPAEPVL